MWMGWMPDIWGHLGATVPGGLVNLWKKQPE